MISRRTRAVATSGPMLPHGSARADAHTLPSPTFGLIRRGESRRSPPSYRTTDNAIGLNPRNERNVSRAKYPTHDRQRAHNPRCVLQPGCLAQERRQTHHEGARPARLVSCGVRDLS